MILHCSFEELSVLNASIQRVLTEADKGGVAAPPDVLPDLEALMPRLTGDLDLDTLAEQQRLERAIEHLLEDARERMELLVLEQYPAAESAVQAYFDFAHLLTVYERIARIGHEMQALIELMTGEPPSEETASSISFEE